MKKFFEEPTQVAFVDTTDFNEEIRYGIAYKNEIICGCCGAIFEIGGHAKVLEELPWISLEEEIKGE